MHIWCKNKQEGRAAGRGGQRNRIICHSLVSRYIRPVCITLICQEQRCNSIFVCKHECIDMIYILAFIFIILGAKRSLQRWEFIKENKKTRTRPRKRFIKHENKNSTTKKKQEKKKKLSFFLDHFLGRVLVFLLCYFLVFFYKFPPLVVCHHMAWEHMFIATFKCKFTNIVHFSKRGCKGFVCMFLDLSWTSKKCAAYETQRKYIPNNSFFPPVYLAQASLPRYNM